MQHAQWQDADRLCRAYLSVHESSAEGHYLLATALFREAHPADSLAEFTHAAQLRTPTATELRWVALDYVLLKDMKDADTWMTKSLAWDSHDPEVWYEMGRIKYEENRFEESVKAFEESLQRSPRSVKAEDNLGLAYEGLNQQQNAITAYRQAIEWQADAAKKSEQPLLNLGILLTDLGRTAEALPLLLEAESIAPAYGKTHATLGKLYQRTGDLPHAQSEFEKAVAADPASASLHFQLGQVYRKQGKTANAATEFAKASEIDGAHSSKAD